MIHLFQSIAVQPSINHFEQGLILKPLMPAWCSETPYFLEAMQTSALSGLH